MTENELINIDLDIVKEFDKIPDTENDAALYIRTQIDNEGICGHISFIGEHETTVKMLVSACKDERLLKLCLYDSFLNLLLNDNTKDAKLMINQLKSDLAKL